MDLSTAYRILIPSHTNSSLPKQIDLRRFETLFSGLTSVVSGRAKAGHQFGGDLGERQDLVLLGRGARRETATGSTRPSEGSTVLSTVSELETSQDDDGAFNIDYRWGNRCCISVLTFTCSEFHCPNVDS